MILACCDIGNTRIKIGVFNNDELINFVSFNNAGEAISFIIPLNPDSCAVSSVVPERSSAFINSFEKESGKKVFRIDLSKKLHLKIAYKSSSSLGTDRICNSEGAYKLFTDKNKLRGKEIIVTADFGTASTYNIIKAPDIFSGGIIAPGPGILFKAMNLYTAQLPEVFPDDYKELIGTDTKSCIASGVMNSVPGLAERIIKKLAEEYEIAEIYVTGGNASLFRKDFNFRYTHVPELLIIGMKAIFDLNQ